MQTIPSDEAIMTDLVDVYRQTKEVVARLKSVFDKVEDQAILSGKAIPLTRLLQSALRAQMQLIGKIERYKKTTNCALQPADRVGKNGANRFAALDLVSKPTDSTQEDDAPKPAKVSVDLAQALTPPTPKQLASLLKGGKKSRRNGSSNGDAFPAPGLLMR